MNTSGIKELVSEVLKDLPEPHAEDTIDQVFLAIEKRPEWLKKYEALVARHGKPAVNSLSGWWIARFEERAGDGEAEAKSKLIASYSRLGGTVKKVGKKVKEQEALDVMGAHYQKNRDAMPASVRNQRALILELLMEGVPVEEAFAKAMAKEAK